MYTGHVKEEIRDRYIYLPSLTVTVAVVESDSPSESVTVSLKFESTI